MRSRLIQPHAKAARILYNGDFANERCQEAPLSDENLIPMPEPLAVVEPTESQETAHVTAHVTLADVSESPDEPQEPAPPPVPRPVYKGIHPELLCQCPECEPDFVELTWFSPEEKAKIKGQIMIYCPSSGRKHFSPAVDLHAWLAPRQTGKRSRGDA
jgi:hypothetical protein